MHEIARALLDHYDAHRRVLPWRANTDPYRVWVSEVMLQQTRVETVVPYYERWLERYPTLQHVAEAHLDDVLKSWEGLGYYSRARNLHKAAQLLRDQHNNEWPGDSSSLRALPGFGEYTAGAVASIAFNEAVPAIDGNVRRIAARILNEARPGARQIHEFLSGVIPAERPGDFNQALMDLGATVCTPSAPKCEACPISGFCAARSSGTQLERPLRDRKAAVPVHHLLSIALLTNDNRVGIRRRPGTGLLAGLWELPSVACKNAQTSARLAAASALRVANEMGATLSNAAPRQLECVKHQFTHLTIYYHPLVCNVDKVFGSGSTDQTWIDTKSSDGPALPAAQKKMIQRITAGVGEG